MSPPKNKKILIVDDEAEVTCLFSEVFKNNGYEVDVARTGQEALGKSKTFHPDLILLDVLLPDMKGMAVVEHLQKDVATRDIPVLVMSRLESPEAPLEASRPPRVLDFLSKPIDTNKLVQSVEKALHPAAGAKNGSVLVVDDDEEFADMLRFFLEEKGYRVTVRHSGKGLVETIKQTLPGVVLLDLMLPDEDGFTVIDRIKTHPETSHVPVLVLTAMKLSNFLDRGMWVTVPRNPQALKVHQESLLREIERQLRLSGHSRDGTRRARVLIADDEEDIKRIIQDLLELEGFEVLTAADGEEALRKIYSSSPDIVLLDVKMPGKDGYELCRLIKDDVLLQHVPVILLTAMHDTGDKIRGLDTGADDYITKPFVPDELLARVRMVLRRTGQTLEANPLTRLPGNVSIERRITAAIQKEELFAVLYIDINNFKAYNDNYGFEKGDQVIRATARVVLDAVNRAGGEQDFIGHIGGDDFIVVTIPERMESLAEKIVQDFDEMIVQFYDPSDKERGYIEAEDRRGQTQHFSLMGLAVGVVSNRHRRFQFYGEVSSLGAEMKKFAKKEMKSAFKVDRRRT